MYKSDEAQFLKNYYNLLKNKNVDAIGNRFMTQIRQLARDGEISSKTVDVIAACITIGESIKGEIDAETLELIKDFINIGIEIKDEKDSKKVAHKLSENYRSSSDSCSNSYSGSIRGGC